MIPKIIHYCWFGDKPIPKLETKCMESWHLKMPEYMIMRWDETNFPFEIYPFAKKALQKKKYAFVADVARLHALINHGGIYLDTDVEILKSLSPLLNNQLVMGFETDNVIQTGVIAAQSHHPYLVEMMEYYQGDGIGDITTDNFIANSALFAKHFAQKQIPLTNKEFQSENLLLLPSEYLCPINQATWEISTTDNTYCIHYLSGSWLGRKDRMSRKIKNIIGDIFGFSTVKNLRKLLR